MIPDITKDSDDIIGNITYFRMIDIINDITMDTISFLSSDMCYLMRFYC